MKDLKLEITAKNALNKFCKEMLAKVLPQLPVYVGKKVFLADGGKAKNFIVDLQGEPDPIAGMFVKTHRCYLTSEYGKMVLKISICLNGGSYEAKPFSTAFTKYIDRDIQLGECKDGQILGTLDTLDNIVKCYGFNQILDFDAELVKIKEYKALLRKAEEAKEKIKVSSDYYKYID